MYDTLRKAKALNLNKAYKQLYIKNRITNAIF